MDFSDLVKLPVKTRLGTFVYMKVVIFWQGAMKGEKFGRNHAKIWTPIRIALSAGLVLPVYHGPLGENTSALSGFLISVLGAIG